MLHDHDLARFDDYLDAIRHRLPHVVGIERRYVTIRLGQDTPLYLAAIKLHFYRANTRAMRFEGKLVTAAIEVSDVASQSDLMNMIENMKSGRLQSNVGDLSLPEDSDERRSVNYMPPVFAHDNDLLDERQLSVVSRLSKQGLEFSRDQRIVEDLKTSETPYSSFEDLLSEFGLQHLQRSYGEFQIVLECGPVAFVNNESQLVDGQIVARVSAPASIDRSGIKVGYKEFGSSMRPVRSTFSEASVNWIQNEEAMVAEMRAAHPGAVAFQLFCTYHGRLEHQCWISDPSRGFNLDYLIYTKLDPNLDNLRDFLQLSDNLNRKHLKYFEFGVATLLQMLGFRVFQFGENDRFTDFVDAVVSAARGKFLFIECTTSSINHDGKITKLLKRAQECASRLADAEIGGVEILPVMVTALSKHAVQPDIDDAIKSGVHVLCKEDVELLLEFCALPQAPLERYEAIRQEIQNSKSQGRLVI